MPSLSIFDLVAAKTSHKRFIFIRFVVVIFCQGECFLFFVIFHWGDCWPIFVNFRQAGVPANHHHQPPPEGPLAVREPGQAHAKISDRFWREDGPARADMLPAASAGIPHRKHGWVAGTRSSAGVHETFEKDKKTLTCVCFKIVLLDCLVANHLTTFPYLLEK